MKYVSTVPAHPQTPTAIAKFKRLHDSSFREDQKSGPLGYRNAAGPRSRIPVETPIASEESRLRRSGKKELERGVVSR
jgi:hypothetical protein